MWRFRVSARGVTVADRVNGRVVTHAAGHHRQMPPALKLQRRLRLLSDSRLLLGDPRVDPSADDNYAIRWASFNGRLEVVKLLLADLRVDPSDISNYAIRWAARNGHLDVVRLLLADSRVDPSAGANYAIYWAFKRGHREVVKLLLSYPNIRLKTPHYILRKYNHM